MWLNFFHATKPLPNIAWYVWVSKVIERGSKTRRVKEKREEEKRSKRHGKEGDALNES